MESSTSRTAEERPKQQALRQQIASLQAQLKEIPEDTPPIASTSPKRKRPESTLLVPPTPSPKKRKPGYEHGKKPPVRPVTRHVSGDPFKAAAKKPPEMKYPKPAPSNVISKLAALNRHSANELGRDAVVRSSAFTDAPPLNEDVFGDPSGPRRDERLALIEDLEPGPVEYTPPLDDPDFKLFEPNSGIRLSSRSVSHEDIKDHLRGRYYLPPSRLYSAIRLLPDKQGYDVPVPGDWITIAVVAERGPIKFSRAPVAVGVEDDENGLEQRGNAKGKRGKGKEEPVKASGKKYVNFRLIDFGARSSSSATGGKTVIRGDAFLSLLLFESDRFDLVTEEGQSKPKKVYKGGSRGAYESLTKVKEGDVIVLLNPRILKPFQRSNDSPHPTNNILAVTPDSADSIMVIGRSRDLGMCTVSKKDGKSCGSWCDKRVSDVCEWHIQNAVERRRAARPEFSIGTTGMSTSAAPKRKPAYDATRQWGLKPADCDSGGSGSTYVVSGHIVGGSSMDSRSLYTTENIGREGQAKAKRRLSGKDADRALKGLLERDKEGMRAVMKAREVGKARKEEEDGGKAKKRKGTEKTKERPSKKSRLKGEAPEDSDDDYSKQETHSGKNAYSAEIVKQLGFNPIAKAGQRRGGDSDMQKKFEALQAAQTARKGFALGPRPGQKVRSGVIAPAPVLKDINLDESDDDLPLGPLEPQALVDLDE